ncbi:MAG: ABC transporter permease [Solirubrobacteraceae bacterium]|nr:ABC transporter permease [Solirubrobacteraceae bacterium]
MSATALPAPPRAGYLRETLLLTGRSLRTIPRVPERLVDVTVQPVIFIVLFLYVLGSAVKIPGTSYVNFLLPGVLAQQLAFSIMGTGVATATDMKEGVVDRFRSLPIGRMSVLSAQVLGQACEAFIGVVVVALLGIVLGWRPEMSALDAVELSGLVLLALIAATWVGVLLGLVVRSADAVQGVVFCLVFPLTFLAGTFVPIAGMAAVPQFIGEYNPISTLVASMRDLTGGISESGSWPLAHPEIALALWCLGAIAICAPLAVRRFKRMSVG